MNRGMNPKGTIFLADLSALGASKTIPAVCKVAKGIESLKKLEREAEVYQKHLVSLQGTVVPKLYGHFTGVIGGEAFGVLLLEYCSCGGVKIKNYKEFQSVHFCCHFLLELSTDPVLRSRQVMIAICALHSAGIRHYDLQPLPGKHWVPNKHITRIGLMPKIVDFSKARPHNCHGAYPAEGHNGLVTDEIVVCTELAAAEEAYGIRSDDEVPFELYA